MDSPFEIIPSVIVHPSKIITYNQIIWNKPHSKRGKLFIPTEESIASKSAFLTSDRTSHGKVSKQAKSKISKSIEYLIATSQPKKVYEKLSGKTVLFKIAFITLTLPSKQKHPDKEIINRCLNSFIIEMTKYYQVDKYVWRAEKQKNGNVHFHLLIDKFVPWYEMRNRWNRIINKLGYVDEFQKLHNHRTPNSTDIHSTRKIKNVVKYVTKYLTKNEKDTQEIQQQNPDQMQMAENKNEQIFPSSGRIWACSQNLSGLKGYQSEIDSELSAEMTKIYKDSTIRRFEDTYYSVFYINFADLQTKGYIHLFTYFSDYLITTLNYNHQLKLAS